MANIVLTTKDADFVAKFIREEMDDLYKAYESAIKEGNERTEIVKEMTKFMNSSDSSKCLAEIENIKSNGIQRLDNKYQEKINKYKQILILMMTGSIQ